MDYTRLLTYSVLALVAYPFLWVAYARLVHPLKHIPGPFWASITRLWIVRRILNGDMDAVQRRLHEQYGPLVRIGPDEVACAAPEAIRKLYPTSRPLEKSDFYSIWQNKTFSKYPDNFSNVNERLHSERRRIVNNVYSMSTVLTLEPYIDTCSALFIQRMGEIADSPAVVDLGEWLQWYAFDVIGELFFGKMFGFMENSHDHQSYIASLDTLLPVLTAAGQLSPAVRNIMLASSLFSSAARKSLKAVDHIAAAARSCVAARIDADEQSQVEKPRMDLLHHLLQISSNKGEAVDFGKGEVEYEAYVAIFAGSDTTAIAMRSVFYHLMKNPETYADLRKELNEATESGRLSSPPSFAEASKLPYLCATIKEAMRLHPSVGLTMPRIVPDEGLEIQGVHVPAGYIIGMNAAVVGYDVNIHGMDSHAFRPDRWLGEQAAVMERHNVAFGAGTRTCIGKNISLSEIHKLIPLALQKFDFSLEDPAKSWQTHNFWFHKQTGLRVRVHRR